MRPSTSGPSISVASLALICCCAVASVLAATPYVPQSAQELTRNAARLVQEQEYEQALQGPGDVRKHGGGPRGVPA